MILEPIFGKVFIKRATVPKQESVVWVPTVLPEDEGTIIHAGGSTQVKKGDYVKFLLRGVSEIQFDNDFIVSVDEDQILAIIN